jgi:hypothetical protein
MLDIRYGWAEELLFDIVGLHLIRAYAWVLFNQDIFLLTRFAVGCSCDSRDSLLLGYELLKVLGNLDAVDACRKDRLILGSNTWKACWGLILSEIFASSPILGWDRWLLADLIWFGEIEWRPLGVLFLLCLLGLLWTKRLSIIRCQASQINLCKS